VPSLPQIIGAETVRALVKLGFRQVRKRGGYEAMNRNDMRSYNEGKLL